MNLWKEIIQLDKQKGLVGLLFAPLCIIVCGAFNHWDAGILLSILFILAGFLKLNFKKPVWKYLLFALWTAAILCVLWLSPMQMLSPEDQMTVSLESMLLNFACIFIVGGLFLIITARPVPTVVISSFLLLLFVTVNGLIFHFRGKELSYMDLRSLKTALNVAEQYRLYLTFPMISAWLKWGFLVFLTFSFPKLKPLPRWKTCGGALIAEGLLVMTVVLCAADIPIKTWYDNGTRINGYYLNFYLGIRDSFVKEPENYHPENIDELAQVYAPAGELSENENRPNIIVIMNESFADFRALGELSTNQPVTPFLDSLQKDTVRGYTLSSVFGGNTANTEFEFLTSQSMAFLPDNSVPYQQYINGELFSLARLMTSYGYTSIATHPYMANGWSRNRVYPYLGFSESTFIEDYPQEFVRNYVGDHTMFTYILDKLTNKTDENPLFLFGITMQNHGGYVYSGEDFENTIALEGYHGSYPLAEQYLSLLHETDSAMKMLLTSLKSFPEKTIVLFFGDHFPMVENEFYEELYGGPFPTLSDQIHQYAVPFLIWANYNISEKTVECTSMNYLAGHLLEAARLPLSPLHQFLSDMEEVVPAMNGMGYYSLLQERFIPYEEATGEEDTWLNQYAALLHNYLFDAKNRNSVFFAQ